jgi:DNA-binding NtrC family response regulator
MSSPAPSNADKQHPRSVLLIDDDARVLASVEQLFQLRGWTVFKANDGMQGVELYTRTRPNLVMLDFEMPGFTGLETLEIIREQDPEATVIMLSGRGDIATAVQCLQLGAENFLAKPLEPRHFALVVDRAWEKSELRRRNRFFAGQQARHTHVSSLGSSAAMQDLSRQLERFAAGSAPILLNGETGSGKGWIAKIIHAMSPRKAEPFVSINCAGLNATFLDSELFGHEKGAFTDAKAQKAGLFEVANGGTVMLDEIGDLAAELQPKLLTVLETQRFRRMGGTRELEVNVRLIAATHVDLSAAVKAGRFREDLFYRISALPVHVPALRERGSGAIAELALALLASLRLQLGRGPARISADALEALTRYEWPGNVRELRNVLERSMLEAGSDDTEILPEHLPTHLQGRRLAVESTPDDMSLATAERKHIALVLAQAGGNRARAAKILGISRQTLYNRLGEQGPVEK